VINDINLGLSEMVTEKEKNHKQKAVP